MLREVLEAVLLGVVQGLTEFIPISSSGHLVLVPELLGLERHGLAFDVALHVGTLFAVLTYFRAELVAMARGLLGVDRTADGLLYRRLALLIVAATVPVMIAGLVLKDFFEQVFATPLVAALMLFVTAALLVGGEHLRDRRVRAAWEGRVPQTRVPMRPAASGAADEDPAHTLPVGTDAADPHGVSLAGIDLRRALLVGLGQCLALFPGISRSGSTIATGMAVGLTREAATRFSFLLSLPALLGAAVLSVPDLGEGERNLSTVAVLAGVIAAFVAGYLAIRFLLRLVARERLTAFAIYCAAAGTVGLLVVLFR